MAAIFQDSMYRNNSKFLWQLNDLSKFFTWASGFFVLVMIALWISYDVFSWVGTFAPNGRIYTYWPVTNYRGIQFACPMEKEGLQYYFLAEMGTLGVTALNNINGLMHDFNIVSALAMEILQSCTKPSIHWSTISLYACIRSISNNRTTIAF